MALIKGKRSLFDLGQRPSALDRRNPRQRQVIGRAVPAWRQGVVLIKGKRSFSTIH
jgi:hypothetical protein